MEELTLEERGNALVAELSGELTLDVSDSFRKKLVEALESTGKSCLVLILTNTNFVDSSGIGCLVALNNMLKEQNGLMILYRPSDEVEKTLNLVRMLPFFTLITEEAELEKAIN